MITWSPRSPRVSGMLGVIGVIGAIGVGCAAQAPAAVTTHAAYEEYTCPPPVGPIVREDCARSALRYEGTSFEASLGATFAEVNASYKDRAIREADDLVSVLKEQRVALCHAFNTCKLTTSEYQRDAARIDESFVALLALRDRSGTTASPDRAVDVLRELRELRLGSELTSAKAAKRAEAAAASTSTLIGHWDGVATQPHAPTEATPRFYGVVLDVKNLDAGRCAEIRYVELECGGYLACRRTEDGALFAEEHLTYGQERCVGHGDVVVRPSRDGSTAFFDWSAPNKPNRPNTARSGPRATATLRRAL